VANLRKVGLPPLPIEGAFNISGRFTDPGPEIYRVSSLDMALEDNDGSGWVELNLRDKRPQVLAEITTEKIDLRPFLTKPDSNGIDEVQSAATDKKTDRVFSNTPWALEALTLVDADIRIRHKALLLRNLAINNTEVGILLKDGDLEARPIRFEAGGGSITGQFSLRSQGKTPAVELSTRIDGLDVGQMLDQLGYPQTIDGNLNADIVLNASGNFTAEMMAGLNGRMDIWMADGRVDHRYFNMLQGFLGSNILRLLNPFKSKKDRETVNCWVNHIEVNDGTADCILLLDTEQTNILAAGAIDLGTESINLGIKPTPKKGYGLNGVGTIGFSFKEFSKPLRLGGTLAKPVLGLDPKRTAFTMGKFAGAVALGPLGIAAFFSDISLGKKDPCAEVLEAFEKGDEDIKKQLKKQGDWFQRIFR